MQVEKGVEYNSGIKIKKKIIGEMGKKGMKMVERNVIVVYL